MNIIHIFKLYVNVNEGFDPIGPGVYSKLRPGYFLQATIVIVHVVLQR